MNDDGLPDLMLRFRTPQIGNDCGSMVVELTGETHAGHAVTGSGKDRLQA